MNIYYFLIGLTIIICFCLAIIVLIQNPKGGGLDSSFGGVSNNTFGAQRTTDFLEKGTWFLAGSLLVLSIISSMVIQNVNDTSSSGLENVQPSSVPVQDVDSSPLNDQEILNGNTDSNQSNDEENTGGEETPAE